jgi:hypothetical protein
MKRERLTFPADTRSTPSDLLLMRGKTWMAGTSPAMKPNRHFGHTAQLDHAATL